MSRILVVDDDRGMREVLDLMLRREGYEVLVAADGRTALDLTGQSRFDLVITDIRMKGLDGIDVLKGVRAACPDTVVILISAFATVETAVTAMREGAYDFIPKPFKAKELRAVVKSALALKTPEAEREVLAEKVREGCHFGNLVGLSSAMQKVYDIIRRGSQTATNILITGESGTGKELVARAIHETSPRAGEQFVAINCGGMPEQLIESELFGYKKGAFTGAAADKPGLFELAHNGTIFLDELAELSLHMQVKLLRVVQEKTFRRVGGTEEKRLDVRFIAATNKDLETEVMAGRFREDLYYRLNVINIHMPPLRDRREDIPLLAQFFLEKYTRAMGKDVRKISAFALDILSNYDFPGNVRELENIIERSVALEQSNIVLPESLTLASFKQQKRINAVKDALLSSPSGRSPAPDRPLGTAQARFSLDDALAGVEKYLLIQALRSAAGIRQKAAELLHISTWRLRGRLERYGLADADAAVVEELAAQAPPDLGIPEDVMPVWTDDGLDLDRALTQVEKYFVEDALVRADSSKTRAAELLGISLRTLHSRLARIESKGE